MNLNVYLSGEIHTDWRDEIKRNLRSEDINFLEPNTDHASSDDCGVILLGGEESKFWHDHKSAKINAMRIRKAISESDVVVVCFGEKYKQWNAAFDAGYAAALGKSIIVLHQPEHQHALKEIDAVALATAETPKQVANILQYVIDGTLQ